MMAKMVFVCLLLGATTAVAVPASDPTTPEPGHLVDNPKNSDGAVTRQAFEARFEASAAELTASRPGVRADRFAAFDIAWPANAQEWKKLNGYAVLLVGAQSHDGSELPLAKVYLTHSDGGKTLLRRIGSGQRQISITSQSGKVFGQNLTQEFYLLPIAEVKENSPLLCDFAKNRLGFVLARALLPPQQSFPASTSSSPPPLAAVKALVTREFSGFGIELTEAAP